MSGPVDRVVDPEIADPRWRGLYIAGGVSALIVLAFVPALFGLPTAASAPFRVLWMVLIALGFFAWAGTGRTREGNGMLWPESAARYMSLRAFDEHKFHVCSECVALCPYGGE